MKGLFKAFAVAAIAAVIGLGITACGGPGGGPINGGGGDNGFVEPSTPRAPEMWHHVHIAFFGVHLDDRVWSIAAGTGSFVAVGGWRPNGTHAVIHSTDGITWTPAAGNFRTELRTVAYGNRRFIAADVGTFGDFGVNAGNYEPAAFYFSTDGGLTWQGPIVVGTGGQGGSAAEGWIPGTGLRSVINIAYGDGRWLAVGLDGQMVYSVNDGVSWTPMFDNIEDRLLPPGEDSAIRDAIFVDGTWIVVGDRGMTAWSNDFQTWNTVMVPNFSDAQSFQRVIQRRDGALIAVSSNANIYILDDMERFKKDTADSEHQGWRLLPAWSNAFGNADIYNIAYGNGYYVILGSGGNIGYSNDGETFNPVNSPVSAMTALYGLAYGGGMWIGGGRGGALVISNVQD